MFEKISVPYRLNLSLKNKASNFLNRISFARTLVKPSLLVGIMVSLPECGVLGVHLGVVHGPEPVEQQVPLVPGSLNITKFYDYY